MDSTVFLCQSPLSPPSYPVCADSISPISFSQPPDDLFALTPPPLNDVSPVVRAPNLWDIASPLTPLTDTPPRIKRKYTAAAATTTTNKRRTLRSTLAISSASSSDSSASPPAPSSSAPSSSSSASSASEPIYTTRSLPPSIPQNPAFPLIYRRFPLSSYYAATPTSDPLTLFNPSHPGGTYNPPRTPLDLYTPRFTRGKGPAKQGLCPICTEPRARGGDSRRLWLAMKFSAFNYHLQYFHGISASTGRPFSPPIAFRTTPRQTHTKQERSSVQEAMCHKCKQWIPIEGIKDIDAKVKELYWWKHAAICHGASELDQLDDPNDVFEHDAVYAVLSKL